MVQAPITWSGSVPEDITIGAGVSCTLPAARSVLHAFVWLALPVLLQFHLIGAAGQWNMWSSNQLQFRKLQSEGQAASLCWNRWAWSSLKKISLENMLSGYSQIWVGFDCFWYNVFPIKHTAESDLLNIRCPQYRLLL